MLNFCFLFFFVYVFLERVYEEHELLVDNLMLWTRDSKNRLLFVERPERTLIFENPSLFNTSTQSHSHATSNFAQVSTKITYLKPNNNILETIVCSIIMAFFYSFNETTNCSDYIKIITCGINSKILLLRFIN